MSTDIEQLEAHLCALCPAPPGADVRGWLIDKIHLLREMNQNGEIPPHISAGQLVDEWYMQWVIEQTEEH